MNGNVLGWNRRDGNRLDAWARSEGRKTAGFAAREEGPMSQGIADGREKQGEMRVGALSSESVSIFSARGTHPVRGKGFKPP
jgi:hypothetical protein